MIIFKKYSSLKPVIFLKPVRIIGYCCFLFLFTTCKKEITESEISSSAIHYLKGSNNDKVTRIRATKDGGFIFCGNTMVGLSNTQGFMLKVDGNGKQQWYKTYGNSTKTTLNDAIECADGSFIAVGGTIYKEGFDLEYVMKADAKGNKQWERSYSYGSYAICGLNSVIQVSDNKIYATGGYPSTRSYVASWIVCFDLDGNLIYDQKIEGLPNYQPKYFNDNINVLNNCGSMNLAINSSNDLLISTLLDVYIFSDQSHIYCPGLLSVKKDKKTVNFFYPYVDKTSFNSYQGGSIYKVIPVNDGNLLCYNSDVNLGSFNYPQIIITKTDLNGVPVWTKMFRGLNSAVIHETFIESDNSITIIGATSSFPTNNEFKESFINANSLVLKLDNNGNELFSAYSKNTSNVEIYKSIQKTANDEFLVAGYTSLNSTSYHKMFIKNLDHKAQLKF
ncbi:MAG: hypothetical protein ACKVQB_05300 [Bacteroidia bacterium]